LKILCGYNANIDSIYSIKGLEINELLSLFPKKEVTDSLSNLPGSISSVPDFIAGLISCMETGSGGEWMILDKSVYIWLKKRYFQRSLLRMGGNMGIMANVLSQLGASEVIPNVVNPSKMQMSFFSKRAIFLPSLVYSSGDKEGSGSSAALQDFDEDPIHFVFDFKKGESFNLYGREIQIPRENRFIATYDPLNSRLQINNEFADYAKSHIKEMDGALISGFHMLQKTYPDGSSYVDKLDNVCQQLRIWKELNSDFHIHVELGHFSMSELAVSVFSSIATLADSIGMNEDELATLSSIHGLDAASIAKMDSSVILEASGNLCDISGLKRIFVHTRDFVISVSRPTMHYHEEVESLRFGVSCAAAFAATGKLDNRDIVMKVALKIGESEYGRQQVNKISEILALHEDGVVCGKFKGYSVCAIPTLICSEPVSTVGLGDTVSAATFLRRLELGA
jgi:ADP-dependent phosphofructokinase/glucokinase